MKEKKCINCNTIKCISEYYKNPSVNGGISNVCKECRKKQSKEYRDKNKNYYTKYFRSIANKPHRVEAKKKYAEENKKAKVAYIRTWRERNKHKKIAMQKVATAIRNGSMLKGRCCFCYGLDVQAHHHDYSKPLDVMWLCVDCHSATHRLDRIKKRNER